MHRLNDIESEIHEHPDDVQLRVQALDCYSKLGQLLPDTALEHLLKLVALDPSGEYEWFSYSNLVFPSGSTSKIFENAWASAIASAGWAIPAVQNAAIFLRHLAPAQALEYWKYILSKSPSNLEALEQIALVAQRVDPSSLDVLNAFKHRIAVGFSPDDFASAFLSSALEFAISNKQNDVLASRANLLRERLELEKAATKTPELYHSAETMLAKLEVDNG